ncbi:MAG: N-acetyl-gamma-glutamyl-phosphate reductase [Lentisphaeria bacterium]
MKSTEKIKVAVVGASGYSGEELLRLLIPHPQVEIACITSRQYAGRHVSTVFPRFTEADLVFTEPDVEEIVASADVAVLALPHGLAAEFAVPFLEGGLRVVDISADFRIKDKVVYEHFYKQAHPAPELLDEAVYGLPEKYREQIKRARLIACPGCYPTSILLPLIPLLAADVVSPQGIAVASLSGVTGAGRKVDLPYIFPECNESVRPYAPNGHRHLPEIEQELTLAAGRKTVAINFVPHLIPVNRGIHSTIYADLPPGTGVEDIQAVYAEAYGAERFVRLLPEKQLADTKHVVGTNMAELGFAIDEHTNRVIISSAIDNLTKGASGQALQCLNLMFGLPETAGLL